MLAVFKKRSTSSTEPPMLIEREAICLPLDLPDLSLLKNRRNGVPFL